MPDVKCECYECIHQNKCDYVKNGNGGTGCSKGESFSPDQLKDTLKEKASGVKIK